MTPPPGFSAPSHGPRSTVAPRAGQRPALDAIERTNDPGIADQQLRMPFGGAVARAAAPTNSDQHLVLVAVTPRGPMGQASPTNSSD